MFSSKATNSSQLLLLSPYVSIVQFKIEYMNPCLEDYDNPGLEEALGPYYWKCGTPFSICVTWRSGVNAESRAQPQAY